MSYRLTIVTGNNGKFKSFQETLWDAGLNKSIPLIQERLDTPELQSDSVAEISMHKAQAAWEKFRRPLLAHDGGLFTNALSGFPGAYIKPVLKMLDIHGLYLLGN